MEIQVYKLNADLYIQVSGRIVLDECEKLKSNTIPLIDKTISQVHLDLARVEFIDSAGLGVLVGLKMTTNKSKARLILVSPSKGVHDILYVSKLDSIFDIVTGNEAEGIRAGMAVTPNLLRSIGKGEGDADPRAGGPGKSGGPGAPAGGSSPSASRPITSFSLRTPQPSTSFMQEPGPAGSESVSDSETRQVTNAREKVDQHCREAVDFMRQGDYDRAAECYLQAIELDPEYLPAHNNLAIVYEKKPAWHQKAVQQWERVLELSTSEGDQKHIDRASKHLSNLRRL